MKLAVIALMAISMTGCGDNNKIQEAVRVSLKDPDSAKFGKLSVVNKNKACLTVNAKNTMGGYTGNQEAFLIKSGNTWEVIDILDSIGHEQCIKLLSKYK